MWLRTENDEVLNSDQVKWFYLDGTRIIAGFGPIAGSSETSDVKLTVKTFENDTDASAGLDRLMGVLGDPISL